MSARVTTARVHEGSQGWGKWARVGCLGAPSCVLCMVARQTRLYCTWQHISNMYVYHPPCPSIHACFHSAGTTLYNSPSLPFCPVLGPCLLLRAHGAAYVPSWWRLMERDARHLANFRKRMLSVATRPAPPPSSSSSASAPSSPSGGAPHGSSSSLAGSPRSGAAASSPSSAGGSPRSGGSDSRRSLARTKSKRGSKVFKGQRPEDLPVMHASIHSAMMTGYLIKKGTGGLKRWKRRFFMMVQCYLVYYRNKEDAVQPDAVPLASINLAGIKGCSVDRKTREFELRGQGFGKYVLRAEDDKELSKWLAAVKALFAMAASANGSSRPLSARRSSLTRRR